MGKMGYSDYFIPNPVNTRKIEFQEQKINAKIVIFLGIIVPATSKKEFLILKKHCKLFRKNMLKK
jgi:hypothetical protein